MKTRRLLSSWDFSVTASTFLIELIHWQYISSMRWS